MILGRLNPLLYACALAALACVLLTGCGAAASGRTPPAARVPLTSGAHVLSSVLRCDRGANAFCAVQLVVADRHYRTSAAFLIGERRHLTALGWTATNADTGDEHAAESPGHSLRLTYATAALDLKDVDLGWVQRAPVIAQTMSRAMFAREAALSLMLETGSS